MINVRSLPDQGLHGHGKHLMNTNEVANLALNCYVFVISDSQ